MVLIKIEYCLDFRFHKRQNQSSPDRS